MNKSLPLWCPGGSGQMGWSKCQACSGGQGAHEDHTLFSASFDNRQELSQFGHFFFPLIACC